VCLQKSLHNRLNEKKKKWSVKTIWGLFYISGTVFGENII
jgi:hypothetical protein